jgi:ribosomal protein S27E
MEVTRNPESGKFRFVSMTEGEYLVIKDDSGLCLGCDNIQSRVEPDATRVTCEDCGKPFVYGIAELLIRDRIRFTAAATAEESHEG